MSKTSQAYDIKEQNSISDPWFDRSEFWLHQSNKSNSRRSKKSKSEIPIVLAGYGVSLRIENDALCIKNGFTHYPQCREIIRLFQGQLNIPPRIILLDCTGSISFQVLNWLREQKIDLIQLNWRGEIICISSNSGFSANPFRVQWQRDTRNNHDQRMAFCNSLIYRKIEGSIVTLEKAVRRNAAWERAMRTAYSTLTEIEERPPATIRDLRILEANTAASYFRAWKGIPIQWRGTTKRPIPDEWRFIGQRTSLFHRAGNRNASHPVNAILNYAYTVAQSEIQMRLIANGYDPTIGIMHEGGNGVPAYAFDLIELERSEIDRRVLEFLKRTVFDPADFVIRTDGVVRLNSQMARVIAVLISLPTSHW